jgi:hypothetical protein
VGLAHRFAAMAIEARRAVPGFMGSISLVDSESVDTRNEIP